MISGDEELLTGYAAEYRRAVAAAHAATAAAERTHAALFDFAGELGAIVARLTVPENPLGLGVRFLRRPPPRLAAATGVHVEEVKDRAPGFAAVVLETPDLWFEVRSDPAKGFEALTNVPGMEDYAARITGVVSDEGRHPHLVRRAADGAGGVELPTVNEAAQLLEAFLVLVGGTYARRAEIADSGGALG